MVNKYMALTFIVIFPLLLQGRPKPFCMSYNYGDGKKPQVVCNSGPGIELIDFFQSFSRNSNKFPSYLSKRSIMAIIEWIYTPDMNLYLSDIPEKERASLVHKLILVMNKGLSQEEQSRFVLRGMVTAWYKNHHQLETWFSIASKKQFLFVLKIFDTEFPKTVSLTQISALYKACQNKKIPIYYGIIGGMSKGELTHEKDEYIFDMSKLRKEEQFDFLYLILPSKQRLKFSIANDTRLYYEDKIPLKQLLPIIKQEINLISPDQRTILDLFQMRDDQKNIKLLRKYGAKTYKELQELKQKKEK